MFLRAGKPVLQARTSFSASTTGYGGDTAAVSHRVGFQGWATLAGVRASFPISTGISPVPRNPTALPLCGQIVTALAGTTRKWEPKCRAPPLQPLPLQWVGELGNASRKGKSMKEKAPAWATSGLTAVSFQMLLKPEAMSGSILALRFCLSTCAQQCDPNSRILGGMRVQCLSARSTAHVAGRFFHSSFPSRSCGRPPAVSPHHAEGSSVPAISSGLEETTLPAAAALAPLPPGAAPPVRPAPAPL